MEQYHLTTSNDSEAHQVFSDTPTVDSGEQQPDAVTQVDRLSHSIELQLPANFSHEAYSRLRDDKGYVISDDLLPALQTTYQLAVVRDHEAARQRSIETIDTLLARADIARIRFDSFIDGARQMPEYASTLVLAMARGGETQRAADDQAIAVLQAIADFLEAQRDDIHALQYAELEIEHAMRELEVSSQFLAACIMQAKTPRPVVIRHEPVRATIPPMPSSPPHVAAEVIDLSGVLPDDSEHEHADLGWEGPVIDLNKISRKRSMKPRGGK